MALSNIIAQIIANRRQEQSDEQIAPYREAQLKQMTLANMAKELAMGQDQELVKALSSATGSTEYVPQSLDAGMNRAPTLADLQTIRPDVQTGPQVGMGNQFTAPDYPRIAADVRMRQGRFGEAADITNLGDALRQRAAVDKMFGGSEQYAQTQAMIDTIGKMGTTLQGINKMYGGGQSGARAVQNFITRNPMFKKMLGDGADLKFDESGVFQQIQGAPEGTGYFVDFKGNVHMINPKSQERKPVDVVTQDASTFLTMKGYDMTTPEGQSTAFKWIATPAGQKEYLNYVDRVSAARYNPPPVNYQFLGFGPTGGIASFDPRTNKVVGSGEIPIGKTAQPITEKAQENLSSGLTALKNLNDMSNLIESQFTEGGMLGQAINTAKGVGSRVGLADSNSKELTNLFDRISADVQATIKGIPSNFDVKVFRGTLPTWRTEKELAKKKIGTAQRMLKTEIKNQVSYYKGTNRIIPQEVLDMAGDLGIDVSNVNANPQPWKKGKGEQPLQKQPTAYVYDPATGTLKPK